MDKKILEILANKELTPEQQEVEIKKITEETIKNRIDRELEKNKKVIEEKDLTTKEIQDRLLQIEKKYEDAKVARAKDKFKDKHPQALEYLNKGLSETEVMKLLDIKVEQTSITNPNPAPGVEKTKGETKELTKEEQEFEKLRQEYAKNNPYFKI